MNVLAAQPLTIKDYSTVTCGAERFSEYLPLLKHKRVAVVTNITGVIGKTSIVDTLLKLKVKVVRIFGPEHGFRSNTEAGETVKNNRDVKTGLPVISLYGKNKKPTAEQLKHVDVVIYDIQDIGTRFYTYISTMTYVMEACARNNKQLIVMDRPNPNGFYIDGPVLQPKYSSFLGLHAVPIVYGMTCGEYAQMVNGEGWYSRDTSKTETSVKLKCQLTVVPMANYDRKCAYHLPVKPSPNIPNTTAVILYPSMGLFEGTIASLGRGTSFPFQVIGNPSYPDCSFSFTPVPSEVSKEPRYVNTKCCGVDLRNSPYLSNHPRQIELKWLQDFYMKMKDQKFFELNFNYHAGNKTLQEQILAGKSPEEIRKSWQPDLETFKQIRKKYLIYQDF